MGRKLNISGALRGVVGIGIAYVLLFQLVFAGFVAERMAMASLGLPDVICSSSDGLAPEDGPSHNKMAPAKCVVCALASALPVLPDMRSALHAPGPAVTLTREPVSSSAPLQRPFTPRSSQGPPGQA